LYSFKDTPTECASLRRNDYLLKLANAVAFFGETYIIRSLNTNCQQIINTSAMAVQLAYSVPQFQQWTDVTNYVGNRESPCIPDWERDMKRRVYDQVRTIAQQNGIPSPHWDTLMSLYHNRNTICHVKPNIAYTNSMRDYASLVDNQIERESVTNLSDLVIRALENSRRAQS
jgi:hypothetical protein